MLGLCIYFNIKHQSFTHIITLVNALVFEWCLCFWICHAEWFVATLSLLKWKTGNSLEIYRGLYIYLCMIQEYFFIIRMNSSEEHLITCFVNYEKSLSLESIINLQYAIKLQHVKDGLYYSNNTTEKLFPHWKACDIIENLLLHSLVSIIQTPVSGTLSFKMHRSSDKLKCG